jgi:peroxiredoxin
MNARSFLTLASFAVLLVTLPAAEPAKGGAQRKTEITLPPDARELQIGDSAPDFSLPGVDGRTYSLADFKDSPLLMVIFMSNHCPYSHAIEGRVKQLQADYAKRGLAIVAICPNHPDAVTPEELGYGLYNDSFPEMKLYAKDAGFTWPYLYDGDTQTTAKAYGCLATPHVFLFDRERKLRYWGRLDDSRFPDPATVTAPDARHAVDALLAGKPVPVEKTKPVGCSTKWASKKEAIREAAQQRASRPVVLENIDADGVAALAKNDTNRLRLINVWATWCKPCVDEFPSLVSLSQRLANRDFEFVTISLDDPKQEAGARKFLEKQQAVPSNRLQRLLKKEGRTSTNFIYTGASTEALTKALDPEWPGPLPYTLIVAPGGRVVYRHTGVVDASEVQKIILQELGAYYK